MTQEEKARAYDEAVEKAKAYHKQLLDEDNPEWASEIEKIFPELKEESTDERMKKTLIRFIKGYKIEKINEFTDKQIIAWLERQGDQQNLIAEINRRIEQYRVEKEEAQSLTENMSLGGRIAALEEILAFQKQGEKKPAEKVAKYKADDWVVTDKNNTVQIKAVENGKYVLENTMSFTIDYVDKCWRKWTIQDAKDGDVLACIGKYGQEIGIIKEYIGKYGGCDKCFETYCFVDWDGIFRIGEYMGSKEIYPATKEQRDLLFKKMHEAGYKWSAEKKELKKVEQTSADETLYPETLEKAIDLYYYSYGNGKGEFEHLSLEKFRDIVHIFVSDYGQKSAWSKEDEHWKQKAIDFIKHPDLIKATPTLAKDTIGWLKSLKDRVQPQWKPSEEQITWLYRAADDASKDSRMKQILNGLLFDLKKLKG